MMKMMRTMTGKELRAEAGKIDFEIEMADASKQSV